MKKNVSIDLDPRALSLVATEPLFLTEKQQPKYKVFPLASILRKNTQYRA